jgi:DNA repair protein RadC
MKTRLKNIKELSVADRPREKFLNVGASALSNAELIAIILRSGGQAIPLVVICKALIACIDNNISTLGTMSVEQISKVKGIGEVKAIELLAAIELGKRCLRQAAPLNLQDDKAVEKLIKLYLTMEQKVQYHLVLINNRDELLATSELDTEEGKMPDLKSIMRLTFEAGAAEIILCRNAIKLSTHFQNQEKAYIIQLDAAASMLQIKMRGLLVIS